MPPTIPPGTNLNPPRDLSARPLRNQPGETSDRVYRWSQLLAFKGFEIELTRTFKKGNALANATAVAAAWAGVGYVGTITPGLWNAVLKKKRSRHPIITARALVGAPKIIDARNGRAGFPRHPSHRWAHRSITQLRLVVGHYTGGPATFLADARFHVTHDYLRAGGVESIAYHLGIDFAGALYIFNDWDAITWHCRFNTPSLGVVCQGAGEMTAAQRRTLRWLVRALRDGKLNRYGYPTLGGRGIRSTVHHYITATSCPGPMENEYRAELVAAGFPFDTTPRTP